MKAIIFNAGRGERLYPLTKNTPKCLLEVAEGECILARQLDLFRTAGIDSVIVVAGYLAHKVEQYLESFSDIGVTVLYNPFYALTNSIVSSWLARDHMHGDFLIINGDTVVHESVLQEVMGSPHDICMAVSPKESYDEEDMKVLIDPEAGLVRDVGKDIPLPNADGESVGLFTFRNEGGAMYQRAIENMLRDEGNLHAFHHSVLRRIIRDGDTIHCRTFDRALWEEVDLDLDMKMLRNNINLSFFAKR